MLVVSSYLPSFQQGPAGDSGASGPAGPGGPKVRKLSKSEREAKLSLYLSPAASVLQICDGNEGHRLVFLESSNRLMETGTGEATFFNHAAAVIR